MSQCPIRPLLDRIVIEPIEAEEKTPGGIFLPDQAKEAPTKGRVLAVGPGMPHAAAVDALVKPEVAVGAIVFFNKWAGAEIRIGATKYLIARAEDILAVMTGPS